jgi:phenylalanyl-tRNA synthetase alpha chain
VSSSGLPSELERLRAIEEEARREIGSAPSNQALVEVRARYLGRKGSLSGLLRSIGKLGPGERAQFGKAANEAKDRIEAFVQDHRSEIERGARDRALAADQRDVTLPGVPVAGGHLHPLTVVERDVVQFFLSLGFTVEEGPEVETEYNNFEALNILADHPSRDMHDTFFVEGGYVLRTHTSPVQIRAMSGRQPPFRFIAPGRVYRQDWGATKYPMFHQIEGFFVDEQVTFGDLKGVLYAFAEHMFGEGVRLRFRSSYFPFTEPSAELDYGCGICGGDGCRTCAQTGWVEWGGCGMIHPVVLENCGIDSDRYQGFAFGMGLDRTAMNRYGIPAIQLLFEGDVRVLEQA